MKTVNIGVVAHVDAGKTSLTERLLHTVGVIDELGSVDSGNTQTDSLEIERQRGITVRSAVASFTVRDVKVNLVDTPGHSDFIAEVARALAVLDGVVVVMSAVEGIQSQTRLLVRTAIEMGMPAILFVNKIDRSGARCADLMESIRESLSPAVLRMSNVTSLGERTALAVPRTFEADFAAEAAEALAELDDAFLERYLDDTRPLAERDYHSRIADHVATGRLYPVFFGSATQGVGISALLDGIVELFPQRPGEPEDDLRGTIFKIDRGRTGEKVAFVRMESGTLEARSTIALHRVGRTGHLIEFEGRPTRIEVFDRGVRTIETPALPGDIAKVSGLVKARVGDQIGKPDESRRMQSFAPPSMLTLVTASRFAEPGVLYAALTELSEEDPHIDVRRSDDDSRTIAVSLYGEVQRQVLEAMLTERYGLRASFTDVQPMCVERPVGTGSAVHEFIHRGHNTFWATVGLTVGPGEIGSGVDYRLSVGLGDLPLSFYAAIEETVRATLQQGLYGWDVVDIVVRLTKVGYDAPHSTAGDFRALTPLVLMRALQQARTQVLEPVDWFQLDTPAPGASAMLSSLAAAGAIPQPPVFRGSTCVIEGSIPSAAVQRFRRILPTLSQGEAVMVTRFHEYRPTSGTPPCRARTRVNPLNVEEYLLHTVRRL